MSSFCFHCCWAWAKVEEDERRTFIAAPKPLSSSAPRRRSKSFYERLRVKVVARSPRRRPSMAEEIAI